MSKESKLQKFLEGFEALELSNIEGGIIKGKSLMQDHSFGSIELVAYNLFDKVISTIAFPFKTCHSEQVMKFIKESGRNFKILRISQNHEYDDSVSVIFCDQENNLMIKWQHNFPESDLPVEGEEEKGDEVAEGTEFDGFFDEDEGYTEEETKDGVEFGFHPTPENIAFVESARIAMPEEQKKDEPHVHIFEKGPSGNMRLVAHEFQRYELNIDEHYNDDFKEADEKIKEWAKNRDKEQINKKLVLLHGIAGAGKTNYVKNLMATCKATRVIYIPPYYVDSLADPGFFAFIQRYKGSLLLIEDAEKVLLSREHTGGASGISILLNLTDGILASILNFKIICTFNSDEKDIDPALKRKGRLFLRYKFDLLKEKKTEALYKKLYDKEPPSKEMSLAEIFESEDNGVVLEKPKSKVMGFVP